MAEMKITCTAKGDGSGGVALTAGNAITMTREIVEFLYQRAPNEKTPRAEFLRVDEVKASTKVVSVEGTESGTAVVADTVEVTVVYEVGDLSNRLLRNSPTTR